MTRTVYYTATTLDGFIATEDHSADGVLAHGSGVFDRSWVRGGDTPAAARLGESGAVLMTAAVTGELSRTTPTTACCRRAETITVLRFAGAVHQEPGRRLCIQVDLDTTLIARRLGVAIQALYGYPTQLQALPTPGYPAAARHRLRMTTPADAAALARRTGLADPRGRLIRGLPAPLVAGGVCDAAAIWRGAFLVGGTLSEPHRFPALEVVCPSLEAAMALTGAARRLGITTRTKHIRDTVRVTVRDPDAITALLTTIGAPDTAATWANTARSAASTPPGPGGPASTTPTTPAPPTPRRPPPPGQSAPWSSSVTRCPKI